MSDASGTSERIDTDGGWTLSEAAAHTGKPAVTFRRWVASGELPAHRFGARGPWIVQPADVARMIHTNRGRL